MGKAIRQTRSGIIKDIPWGTHFCQFYQSKDDLIDILVPYFKTGLENNEFCMWVTSEPLDEKEAAKALRKAVANSEQYIRKGQIEIVPYTEWYLKGGVFDLQRVLNGWVDKLNKALSRGYSGMRVTGNTAWLEKTDWKSFTDYEAAVNDVITKYKMVALCTYRLDRCSATDVIDVIHNHEFALIKREGKWEVIESAAYKQTKEALSGALEELEEIRQDLNRAQAVAHTGSWRLNVQRNELLWSNETHRIFGIPKETLMTYETFLSSVHPDDREYVDRKWNAALRGEHYDIEHRIVVGNDIKWVRERAELEFDDKGVLLGGFGTVQDITELKKAQTELTYLASFPELDPIPVLELDIAGNIRYLNPAAKTLLHDLQAQGTRHPFLANWEALVNTIRSEKLHSLTRDVNIDDSWYEQTIISVPSSENLRLYSRDITERKKLEELKDEFIGLVSHEVRTPLTVIIGGINTVLTEGERLPPAETHQLLEDAAFEAETLSHIFENLLELSRAQANRLFLRYEPVSIQEIAQEVAETLKGQYPHRFVMDFPEEIPQPPADRLRVKHILYNLMHNAAKYSPHGSEVRVFARQEANELVIGVEDQGGGISPADKARLFGLFERLGREKSEGTKGTGIGLVVCQRLVEAHGGRIWVETEPERGSTFLFTLPLNPAKNKGL